MAQRELVVIIVGEPELFDKHKEVLAPLLFKYEEWPSGKDFAIDIWKLLENLKVTRSTTTCTKCGTTVNLIYSNDSVRILCLNCGKHEKTKDFHSIQELLNIVSTKQSKMELAPPSINRNKVQLECIDFSNWTQKQGYYTALPDTTDVIGILSVVLLFKKIYLTSWMYKNYARLLEVLKFLQHEDIALPIQFAVHQYKQCEKLKNDFMILYGNQYYNYACHLEEYLKKIGYDTG